MDDLLWKVEGCPFCALSVETSQQVATRDLWQRRYEAVTEAPVASALTPDFHIPGQVNPANICIAMRHHFCLPQRCKLRPKRKVAQMWNVLVRGLQKVWRAKYCFCMGTDLGGKTSADGD